MSLSINWDKSFDIILLMKKSNILAVVQLFQQCHEREISIYTTFQLMIEKSIAFMSLKNIEISIELYES